MYDTKLDGRTCRAARAFLNWSSRQLSIEAKVSVASIYDLERGRPVDRRSAQMLALAFADAGVEIIERGGRAIGVRESETASAEHARA
jgi:transcriptional regulator with XRE-family HTH domain